MSRIAALSSNDPRRLLRGPAFPAPPGREPACLRAKGKFNRMSNVVRPKNWLPPSSSEEATQDLLADIAGEIKELHSKLDLLTQHHRDSLRFSYLEHRHDKTLKISHNTKAVIQNVIAGDPFRGKCPCCFTRDVLSGGAIDPTAEFDHFYSGLLTLPECAWLLCRRCHSDIGRSVAIRLNATPNFHSFQSYVIDYLERRRGVIYL